jgi:hypothetical protein
MDDVRTLLTYSIFGDYQRERHISRMQELRNQTAAFDILKVATVIQGGATANEMKGTAPFVFRNAAQGMATMVTGGTPFAPVRVYTPVAVPPVKPAPKGRGRGRSRR